MKSFKFFQVYIIIITYQFIIFVENPTLSSKNKIVEKLHFQYNVVKIYCITEVARLTQCRIILYFISKIQYSVFISSFIVYNIFLWTTKVFLFIKCIEIILKFYFDN